MRGYKTKMEISQRKIQKHNSKDEIPKVTLQTFNQNEQERTIKEVRVPYFLMALIFTLSFSEPISCWSLLSMRWRLFSWSTLDMEERIPKGTCCDTPSAFPVPVVPGVAPGLLENNKSQFKVKNKANAYQLHCNQNNLEQPRKEKLQVGTIEFGISVWQYFLSPPT